MAREADIYYGGTLNGEDRRLRGYFDGRMETEDGLPRNATPQQIAYYRKHPVLRKREKQLRINLLGLYGGRPYVNARLSRFAGETSIDWSGGTRSDGSSATGRLQQTHAFPYLGRINAKINQHVFSKLPLREGANPAILSDISRDGESVNSLMREASSYLFACGWCWIGIDAPTRKPDGTEYSLLEKEQRKIRPYWSVYEATDVLDWHFSEQGELEWIKTKHCEVGDADPRAPHQTREVVRLWEKGQVSEYEPTGYVDFNGKPKIKETVIPLTLMDQIPFVLVGTIEDEPIAFDDLESINRTIMDLGSVDRANFFNVAYPQLVLPANVISNAINSGYATNATEAGKMIVGFKNPILIDKDDPTPSYLMPDAASIGTIGTRISELKRDMFEVVGLALERESRQVASAESKAWDFLDVAAVMRSRAEILQEAEQKAVELSVAWDSTFSKWTPAYNTDFDVGDFESEIRALIQAGNIPAPASVTREVLKKLMDRIDRIGTPISADAMKQILADIDGWEPTATADIFGTTPAITG